MVVLVTSDLYDPSRTEYHMKRTTIIPTLVSASLLFAACASDSNEDVGTDAGDGTIDQRDPSVIRSDDPARSAKVALRQFDQCDAFLDYVHTEGAERVGAYGFNDVGWHGGPDVMFGDRVEFEADTDAMVEEAAEASDGGGELASAPAAPDAQFDSADESSSGDAATSSGGDFSTTNVQVEGVDEPDIIKTDGERILVLADGTLHYVDVDGTTVRSSIELNFAERNVFFWGQEILVSGDRVFVIGQTEGGFAGGPEPLPVDAVEVIEDTEPVLDGDAESQFVDDDIAPIPVEPTPLPMPIEPGFHQGPTTMVVEVDVSNPDALQLANSLTLDGRYISARAIGDTVRVAVTTPPQNLGFLFPSGPNAEESATEANRRLVQETTLDDWLPTWSLTDADGATSDGALVDCARIHAPAEFAGFDMLSVVTLPFDAPLSAPTGTTSVMATGDTVYASQDRMYISTNEWLPPTLDEQSRGQWEETYQTGIHRFSLPAGEPAQYEASGAVDGHLLNQFSMNDRDGTFFVATTTGTPWSSDGSVSQIVAMQTNGDRLEQVGVVGGLGQGERIFSVRYVGDVAYVVTFRQTDPFYVIDTSTPTDMKVLGELKIPGVSNYLHPISDTLVLGVGQDATDEGFQTGSKVSLFDVSDPANPTELDVWTLPGSNSSAEFDHRAFLWWEATSSAVLPLTSWQDQFSGAVVLNVTADGITEQGRVTHELDDGTEPGITDCEVFSPEGLTEEDGELFWIAQEGGQLQLCGPNDQGGATEFYCEVIPVNEIENWFGTDVFESTNVDLTGVDRIEWCWPDGGVDWQKQIQRTLVIGDQLWTMSATQLQANDLGSLDTTATVTL